MSTRPYDHTDREALWELKRGFERELGALGTDGKADRYERKLTDAYRDRYLAWVERCLGDDPSCIQLAVVADEPVGYVFVLPETLSMVWDAGVINELYLAPPYRGEELADELLVAALEVVRAQSLPLDRIVLDVDPANTRARAVYDRHGFERWGELLARPLDP